MKFHNALYCLLLMTLCLGCGGRRYMPQLERLETQVDSVPHLVSQALDSMPSRRFRGEPRALYALLKTQADYKSFVPITSDSLIRQSCEVQRILPHFLPRTPQCLRYFRRERRREIPEIHPTRNHPVGKK